MFSSDWTISSLPNCIDSNLDIYLPPVEVPLVICDALFYERPLGKTRKVKRKTFQMVLSELKLDFKKWETILSENIISLTGNKDHLNACLSYMLYCLTIQKPFKLAYYITKRIESVTKSDGFTQTLPQPTPIDFEPFFSPINLSMRGSRMSAQLEPLLSRDQVLQELCQYQDFTHRLEAAIQNAQNVQDILFPHFTTTSSPIPPSSYFTTTFITATPPFRPILPPSNTFIPVDHSLWMEGPSSLPQPQEHS
nr:hypothetical protein [Tanacetum cinerariifolium]